MKLRVAQRVRDTEAEGPGVRYAFWVQGCSIRCPGCCNPEMFQHGRGGIELQATELAEDILRTPGIEGLSVLGGEPFEQASGVAEVCRLVKASGKSVMVYSGYTLGELKLRAQSDAGAQSILETADLLLDGRFDASHPEKTRRWVGSTNQVLHFLTDRYRADDPRFWASNSVELRLEKGQLTINGWPAPAEVFRQLLRGGPSTRSGQGLDTLGPGPHRRTEDDFKNTVASPLRTGSRSPEMSIARVTPSEAHILSLVRCVLGVGPGSEILRLLLVSHAPPAKLGPTSANLLRDSLARGLTHTLLLEGGWSKELGGRLWDQALPPLRFTGNTIRMLNWVLRMPLADPEVKPLQLEGEISLADEVLAALLLERARGSAAEPTLVKQEVFRRLPFVQLMHAFALGRTGPFEVVPVRQAHFPFIRGLLDLLGKVWLSTELSKGLIPQPATLIQAGRAQLAVATAFLDVIDTARQRLLARFLVDAAAAWLDSKRMAKDLVGLDPESPLRDRGEARRQAAGLWRLVQRLEQWDQQHRSTHFVDDDYATAQGLVRSWEKLGPRGFAAAHSIITELEALPS